MTRFHQREVWRHGSCFLVRQVQSMSARQTVVNPNDPYYLLRTTHEPYPGVPMPNRVIFYQGRFLARVDVHLVDRWIEYYARRLLTTGRV